MRGCSHWTKTRATCVPNGHRSLRRGGKQNRARLHHHHCSSLHAKRCAARGAHPLFHCKPHDDSFLAHTQVTPCNSQPRHMRHAHCCTCAHSWLHSRRHGVAAWKPCAAICEQPPTMRAGEQQRAHTALPPHDASSCPYTVTHQPHSWRHAFPNRRDAHATAHGLHLSCRHIQHQQRCNCCRRHTAPLLTQRMCAPHSSQAHRARMHSAAAATTARGPPSNHTNNSIQNLSEPRIMRGPKSHHQKRPQQPPLTASRPAQHQHGHQ